MKPVLIAIIVAALTSTIVYRYAPLQVVGENSFGSITTIQGSDTITSSRATINANFTDLDTRKFSLSDWYATTSATHLVTLGTITTGTWNATPITVTYGGTGSTTLSSNQILLGNGTGIVKTVSGFGNSGQFLTSNGAATAPTWATSSVSLSDDYAWTGFHTFTRATSTIFSIFNTLYVGTSATTTISGSATSTFAAGASTTNMSISGACTGCPMAYTASSTAIVNTTGTVTYTGSIPALANTALIDVTIDCNGLVFFDSGIITRSGKTVSNHNCDDPSDTDAGRYTITWTGNNLVVVETVDTNTNVQISGTVYYYK